MKMNQLCPWTGMLKVLTIAARLMRQDFFDFKPQPTLIIFGNTQPSRNRKAKFTE